jgi:hypothetical protein
MGLSERGPDQLGRAARRPTEGSYAGFRKEVVRQTNPRQIAELEARNGRYDGKNDLSSSTVSIETDKKRNRNHADYD